MGHMSKSEVTRIIVPLEGREAALRLLDKTDKDIKQETTIGNFIDIIFN